MPSSAICVLNLYLGLVFPACHTPEVERIRSLTTFF